MSAFNRAIASVGGIVGACGGAVSVMSLALSFLWEDATAPYVLAALGALVFVGSVIGTNFNMSKKLVPELGVRCGPEARSIARNHTRKLVSGKTAIVDFFSFEITNTGATPIPNCHATLVRVEKAGAVVWDNPITLSFEPFSATENEPIESVTLDHNIPRCVSLLTTMLTSGDQWVEPGSLGMTSRWGADFWIALEERTSYTLVVRISGDNIATVEEEFTFQRPADSSNATIVRKSKT